MIKKILALILSILFLLSITACQAPAVEPAQPHEIKNIILLIGDGFGFGHLEAAEIITGKEAPYRSWHTAYSDTTNVLGGVTDSAAGATALATGTLTRNSVLGLDQKGNVLQTIMDYANEAGKATGIVTTDSLSGATPSGFSAHAVDRDETDVILKGQLNSGVKLLCGTRSSEAMNWANSSTNTSYTFCTTKDAIEANMNAEKAYWQLSLNKDLSSVVEPALRYLSQDEDGFVLMIEQAHIDKYAHSGDIEGVINSVIDLNETVETILEWIGDRNDTAIIITADHETGALQISPDDTYNKTYTAENGNSISYFFGSTGHSAKEVGVFIYGFTPEFEKYYKPGSTTTIKNTQVFYIMQDLLNNPVRS